MTRKDYIKFAKMINKRMIPEPVGPVGHAKNRLLSDIAHDCAKIFAADNERFDYDRFITATGVEDG